MTQRFLDYFRCPPEFCRFKTTDELPSLPGFFSLGENLVLFGRSSVAVRNDATDSLKDARPDVQVRGAVVELPFDASEIADNFYHERYAAPLESRLLWRVISGSYYGIRPILPTSVRKYLQKLYFRGWQDIRFPKWPLDDSLDRFQRELMAYLIRARGEEIPFIWFWPDAHSSCCILTHDVEHAAGLAFCRELLRIDEEHGFKSSFQFVPEKRYNVPAGLREEIRTRGYEVNVHDINHDGHLFRDRAEFLRRAQRINEYARQWDAAGFRSGSMYRNLDWIEDLNFLYDMSCPNSAHLEPQRGGCCSIFPFLVGSKVELPLTMSQDYTLYYILGTYTTELWERQRRVLTDCNGLMSLNVHPDYVLAREGRRAYCELLKLLSASDPKRRIWQALPGEVAHWWRQRQGLALVRKENEWQISGAGAERAQVAFACLRNGELHYRVGDTNSLIGSGVAPGGTASSAV